MQRLVIISDKNNKKIEAWAADFGGNMLAVYIEDPPPVEGRPENWTPTFICPDCMEGKLKQGSGVGPNNSVIYLCQNRVCGMKWKRNDEMMTGIVLESA